MNILVVDDNKENRYLLETLLKGNGYQVISAENGRKALDYLETRSIDLVVADILMPVMDGFQLCKHIRNHEQLKRLPFVFYTATYTSEKDEEFALKLGADRFIRKPSDPEDFISEIQEVLRDYEHRRLPPHSPGLKDEDETYKLYSERLVNKLEKKILDLEKESVSRQKAYEELNRLSTAIEHAADSIIITDPSGAVQYVNPAFERISGYHRPVVIGENISIIRSGRHDASFYRDVWEKISNGETWTGHIVSRMRDGELREFETIISPIRDHTGGIVNFVSVNRDVTNEMALEARLRQSQKMEAIGTLAGGIAHDFNNILTAILGYTEMAMDAEDAGEPTLEHLTQVLQAASRAKEVVKQILTFSRQADHETKPVKLQRIVTEAFTLLRASLPTTIDIQMDLSSESLIMANPGQIHQVLMNLGTNAAQAMGDTGGLLTVSLIEVVLTRELSDYHPDLSPGRYVKLTVGDTGIGMSPAVSNRAFEPFFTTKAPGTGTGMGLAAVHGIVKSHSGAIDVESEKGKGSIFTIHLPILESVVKPSVEMDSPLPTGTERILFVDDEPPLAQLGNILLGSLGYAVTSFSDSHEALQAFKASPHQYDLVITDMTMPRLTGDALAAAMLAIRPDIPIILCTGFSVKMNHSKATELGIRALTIKPLNKRDLAKLIRDVLDNS